MALLLGLLLLAAVWTIEFYLLQPEKPEPIECENMECFFAGEAGCCLLAHPALEEYHSVCRSWRPKRAP